MRLRYNGEIACIGDDGTQFWGTQTCAHCNRVANFKPETPLENLGSFCYGCGKVICQNPACHRRCDVIEKKLERIEAVARYGQG